MAVSIGPFQSNPIQLNVSLRPQVQSRAEQEISAKLNAPGRVQVGEGAKQEALNYLQKILQEKSFQVSALYDGQKGMSQVTVVDNDSGKEVVKLPADTVVNIAERAKQSHLGWLIDKSI